VKKIVQTVAALIRDTSSSLPEDAEAALRRAAHKRT
jgi:hypothetical protein